MGTIGKVLFSRRHADQTLIRLNELRRYALSSSDNSEEGSEGASESSDYKRSTRDHGAKKTIVAEEIVETLFESTSAEQLSSAKAPRAVLKQGTLTGYLSKKVADSNAQ